MIGIASRSNGYQDHSNGNYGDGNANNDNPNQGNSLESASPSPRRYLHIILVNQNYGKKQVPVDITRPETEYLIFEHLNNIYREHRGALRALTSVKALHLTSLSAWRIAFQNAVETC